MSVIKSIGSLNRAKIVTGRRLGRIKSPLAYGAAAFLGLGYSVAGVIKSQKFSRLAEARSFLRGHKIAKDRCVIVSVRHPATENSETGRTAGRIDVPLAPAGKEQMLLLGKALADFNFSRIYSSPLKRCSIVAKLMSVLYDDLEIDYLDDLRELNYGLWAGRILSVDRGGNDSLEKLYPKDYQRLFSRPDLWRAEGAETFLDLADRVNKAMRKIAQDNPGQAVLVVGHGWAHNTALAGAFGVHLAHCLEIPLGKPTSVNIIDYSVDYADNHLWLWANADHLTSWQYPANKR